MRFLQFRGPFESEGALSIPSKSDYTYVKIGFQIPHRDPIRFASGEGDGPDLSVNGQQFKVQDGGILEFSDLGETYLDIKFLKDLPEETVIDVVCDIEEY